MEKICYHRVFVRFLPPVRDKALRLTQSNKKSNLIFTLFFFQYSGNFSCNKHHIFFQQVNVK